MKKNTKKEIFEFDLRDQLNQKEKIEKIKDEFLDKIDDIDRTILLILPEAEKFDFLAINLIAGLYKTLNKKNIDIILKTEDDNLKEILKFLGLDKYISLEE